MKLRPVVPAELPRPVRTVAGLRRRGRRHARRLRLLGLHEDQGRARAIKRAVERKDGARQAAQEPSGSSLPRTWRVGLDDLADLGPSPCRSSSSRPPTRTAVVAEMSSYPTDPARARAIDQGGPPRRSTSPPRRRRTSGQQPRPDRRATDQDQDRARVLRATRARRRGRRRGRGRHRLTVPGAVAERTMPAAGGGEMVSFCGIGRSPDWRRRPPARAAALNRDSRGSTPAGASSSWPAIPACRCSSASGSARSPPPTSTSSSPCAWPSSRRKPRSGSDAGLRTEARPRGRSRRRARRSWRCRPAGRPLAPTSSAGARRRRDPPPRSRSAGPRAARPREAVRARDPSAADAHRGGRGRSVPARPVARAQHRRRAPTARRRSRASCGSTSRTTCRASSRSATAAPTSPSRTRSCTSSPPSSAR